MIGVLKEELRESHSGGAEEGMIRASLRGRKGSVTEQRHVKSRLLLFALVPEDTHCPLEVLLLMFEAAHEGSGGATLMHIRKWLRILINRSLVLGTIDRPSVHDLVLDFAEAQHTKDELCRQHSIVVDAFRAARAADMFGRRKFDKSLMFDPRCEYVCHEITHHVTQGWCLESGLRWLADAPQDEIVIAAGHAMGMDKLSSFAVAAESGADWWLADDIGRLVRS